MAGGVIVPSDGPAADYGGSLTLSVFMTCLVAASGGLIFGYDIGISGGVYEMEPFLRRFFPRVLERMASAKGNEYCIYDSQTLTAFTSSLYVAGLLASLVASRVTKAMGRQAVMLMGGALFFAGGAVTGAAVNIAMLIVGRMLLGFGVGFTNQVLILSKAIKAQSDVEKKSHNMAISQLQDEIIELRKGKVEKTKIPNTMDKDFLEYQNMVKSLTEEKARIQFALDARDKRISELEAEAIKKQEENDSKFLGLRQQLVEAIEKNQVMLVELAEEKKRTSRFQSSLPAVLSSGQVEGFSSVLDSSCDYCALASARGIACILEKADCCHLKMMVRRDFNILVDNIQIPLNNSSSVRRGFFTLV